MAKKYLNLPATLKKLMFDRNIRPVDLARDLKIPPPTIHRIVTGQSTRPYKSSLEPIADYFNISVDQLTGEKPLKSQSLEANIISFGNNSKIIQIIPWESLENLDKYSDHENKLVVANVSDKAFAVINPDHAMEPLFQKESTLIFDPALSTTDRCYVLVKLNASNVYVFRQLLIDIEHKFIKSLNPDLSANSLRLLTSEDRIIARLVEVRNKI